MPETRNASPLRIGWSGRDVTPERPVALRGQFHVRVSGRVNDPLTVTALGGYLPTTRALGGKSYSAVPASLRVGPEGGQELVNQTLAAMAELWDDEG